MHIIIAQSVSRRALPSASDREKRKGANTATHVNLSSPNGKRIAGTNTLKYELKVKHLFSVNKIPSKHGGDVRFRNATTSFCLPVFYYSERCDVAFVFLAH